MSIGTMIVLALLIVALLFLGRVARTCFNLKQRQIYG